MTTTLPAASQPSEKAREWAEKAVDLHEEVMGAAPGGAESDLPPIKTEREQAMRETIHGQGLSMRAMSDDLRARDAEITRLRSEIADYMMRDAAEYSTAIEVERLLDENARVEAMLRSAEREIVRLRGGTPARHSTVVEEDGYPGSLVPNARTAAISAEAYEASGRQPEASGEDVERAREIGRCDAGNVHCFAWLDHGQLCDKCTEIAGSLTAARRAGAEAMRERAALLADPLRKRGLPDDVRLLGEAIRALPTDTDAPTPEETR